LLSYGKLLLNSDKIKDIKQSKKQIISNLQTRNMNGDENKELIVKYTIKISDLAK